MIKERNTLEGITERSIKGTETAYKHNRGQLWRWHRHEGKGTEQHKGTDIGEDKRHLKRFSDYFADNLRGVAQCVIKLTKKKELWSASSSDLLSFQTQPGTRLMWGQSSDRNKCKMILFCFHEQDKMSDTFHNVKSKPLDVIQESRK